MPRTDTGLTEASIAVVVDRFYEQVRRDAVLGPVFNAVVTDWDQHKRLLASFWASVALGARTYRGNQLAKHRPLPIDGAHFARWLELWHETTHRVLNEQAAAVMSAYAERIAQGLRVGIGLQSRPRPRSGEAANGSARSSFDRLGPAN